MITAIENRYRARNKIE